MKDIHSFVILAHGENDDLEECIKSIKKQSVKSNVLIATSTENDFIMELARKYSLGVMINENKKSKAEDYNFCLTSVDTKLITIVHQNDLYHRNYAKEVIKAYRNNKDASIIFTNYYLVVGDKKIETNKELKINRLLVLMLKYKRFNKSKYFKRLSLKYKNAICTSSVTFVRNNLNDELFLSKYKYNLDWDYFERISMLPQRFIYLNDKLVGNRKDKEKKKNKQWIKEDKELYQRFWPLKLIDIIYKKKIDNIK